MDLLEELLEDQLSVDNEYSSTIVESHEEELDDVVKQVHDIDSDQRVEHVITSYLRRILEGEVVWREGQHYDETHSSYEVHELAQSSVRIEHCDPAYFS